MIGNLLALNNLEHLQYIFLGRRKLAISGQEHGNVKMYPPFFGIGGGKATQSLGKIIKSLKLTISRPRYHLMKIGRFHKRKQNFLYGLPFFLFSGKIDLEGCADLNLPDFNSFRLKSSKDFLWLFVHYRKMTYIITNTDMFLQSRSCCRFR